MSERSVTRLEPMDALRGIAALCVAVFSHYQHWGSPKEHYPFGEHTWATWLYGNSWLFVDLFFVLSGMVMTLVYLEPIASERLGAKEFFWLRLSRLYPLHLATLLICAAVEWTLMARGQPTVIYPSNNDLYHFFLHAMYLHSGWFESGWSYNMPSWSVCSEVLVYGLFFAIAVKYKKGYPVACWLLFLAGMGTLSAKMNYPIFNELMARAMVGFAEGSLLWLGIVALKEAGYVRALGTVSFVAAVGVCVLGYFIGYDAWIGQSRYGLTVIIFPLIAVASITFPPLAKVLSIRPLTFLGDISYAVYLMHVPLQMVVLSYVQTHHITLAVNTYRFFFEYAGALVIVSTIAHYGLERPAQKWLRGRMRPTPKAAPIVAERAAASQAAV